MSLTHALENVVKERDELRTALTEAYEEIRKKDLRIAELESFCSNAAGNGLSIDGDSVMQSDLPGESVLSNNMADAITNDEVTSTLQRLASNEGVDERLDVSPNEMARMVESNARFRATMGQMSTGAMLSLRDEIQSAFNSIGAGAAMTSTSAAATSTSSARAEQARLLQAEMPDLTRVYEFSDTTYVMNPASNTGIAVRSGADGISFAVHADPTIEETQALAEKAIERAKAAEKERDAAERGHKKLKDNFNAKVAEKAGYYKQYAKLVSVLKRICKTTNV
jgi:hypothetical protein